MSPLHGTHPHTIPLPYLTRSATEHPIIHIPSLPRTSNHSADPGVPKFPGLGCDSCDAAHCVPAVLSSLALLQCTLLWDSPYIWYHPSNTSCIRPCLPQHGATGGTRNILDCETLRAPPWCCGPGRSRDIHEWLWNATGPLSLGSREGCEGAVTALCPGAVLRVPPCIPLQHP